MSAHLTAARAHLQAGRLAEAEAACKAALEADPNDADGWLVYAQLATRVRQFAVAAQACERATSIRPDDATAHYELGNAHRLAGSFDAAIAAYREALRLRADYADVLVNLGAAFAGAARKDEAIEAWQAALRLNADDADALGNLGNIYRDLGRLDDAIAYTQRAIAVRPDQPWLLSNLANAYAIQGDSDRAIALYRRAVAAAPKSASLHSNLLIELMFSGTTASAEVFAEHRAWAQQHEELLGATHRPHDNDRDPDRRLRVGYVSSDFRQHVVSFFFEPILAHHDREQFEVFCYSRVPGGGDAYTRRMRGYGHTWREIFGVRDARVAELIRNDRIDILVDLAGHTALGRPLVFARRPAPVQVSYLGSPGSSGMASFDYRITDAVNDPPGVTERFYTEQLVRLPRCAWAFRPWDNAPPVAPLPPCAERGYVTFGSFNRSSKISAPAVAAWSRVLHATPTSKLMVRWSSMADAGARRLLFERFAAHGIAADRIDPRAGSPTVADYLADYALIDVALDTFPYNGVTTTCDALYMGVPVVALAGDFHAARIGATLLTAAGLDELLADNVDDYVRLATALASDPARIETCRRTLRPRIEASPLVDGASLTRAIESAYRAMWVAWCSIV